MPFSNEVLMKRYRYAVVIEKDEKGVYIASCPAFTGCHTQGETYEEAMANIKDAINLNIAARRDLGEPIPIETAIDEIEIHL